MIYGVMMRRFFQLLLPLFAMIIIAALALRAGGDPVPANVGGAERTIAAWLKALKGKSQAQVEKELGADPEKATWEFMGKQVPLLRYKTSTGGKVELRLLEDRVVNASFFLTSP